MRDDCLVAVLQALRSVGVRRGSGRRPLRADAVRAAPGSTSRSCATATPLTLVQRIVPTEWVDYNGHTNDSRYLSSPADAVDAFMRLIGVDEAYLTGGHSYFTVESHLHLRRPEPGRRPGLGRARPPEPRREAVPRVHVDRPARGRRLGHAHRHGRAPAPPRRHGGQPRRPRRPCGARPAWPRSRQPRRDRPSGGRRAPRRSGPLRCNPARRAVRGAPVRPARSRPHDPTRSG